MVVVLRVLLTYLLTNICTYLLFISQHLNFVLCGCIFADLAGGIRGNCGLHHQVHLRSNGPALSCGQSIPVRVQGVKELGGWGGGVSNYVDTCA